MGIKDQDAILDLLFSESLEQKTVRSLRKDIEKLPEESHEKFESEVTLHLKRRLLEDCSWGLLAVSLYADSCCTLQRCLKNCLTEILSSCLLGLQGSKISIRGIPSEFHCALKALYGLLQHIINQSKEIQENPAIRSQLKQIYKLLIVAVVDDQTPPDGALICATSLCLVFTYFSKDGASVRFLKLLQIVDNASTSCNSTRETLILNYLEEKFDDVGVEKEESLFCFEDIRTSYPVLLVVHGLLNSNVSWIYSLKNGLKDLSNSGTGPLGLKHLGRNEISQCASAESLNVEAHNEISSSKGRQIFLYSMFPLIRKLCTASLSYTFQAFQVLQCWLQRVRKMLKNMQITFADSPNYASEDVFPSNIPLFNINSESSHTVFHLLNSNWENPSKGVADVAYSCASELLQLHEDETPGQARDIALWMISTLVYAAAWNSKSTYPPFALAFSHVLAEEALQRYPSIPKGLISSLSVNYLAPAGTSVYKIILSQLSSDHWKMHFLSPLSVALHSADRMTRQNALTLWLPVTIRQYPDIHTDLLSYCQMSSEGWMTRMAILRTARMSTNMNLTECDEIVKDKVGVAIDKGHKMSSIFDTLQYAINHADENVRSEALSFLCHTKKASEPIIHEEAHLLKEFFDLNINIDSSPFRQNVIKCFKALVVRLRDACMAELRKATYQMAFNKDGFLQKSLKQPSNDSVLVINGNLLLWFLLRFNDNLKPVGNYQRRILSLQLYKEILLAFYEVKKDSGYVITQRFMSVCSLIHDQLQNQDVFNHADIKTQPTIDLTLPWTREMLLYCCLDEMNDIREEAESILHILNLFRHEIGDIKQWLLRGLSLCNSPKASGVESGASVVKVLSVTYGSKIDLLALLQKEEISSECKTFHDFLFGRVESQFRAAKENLLLAARFGPIHGSLLALGRCLCENSSPSTPSSGDLKQLLDRLMDILEEIIEFMLSVLALSSENGSAVAPSFAEMGESIELIIEKCKENGNSQPHDCDDRDAESSSDLSAESVDEISETAISGDHALVLACCWQSMKACCLVSTMCTSRWLSLLTENRVERILKLILIRVLTGTRHKGAMEAARNCYGQLSTLLLSSNSSLGHLICSQVDEVLNQLKVGAQTSITRRAAGMAMMIQVACGAIPRSNRSLIDTVVVSLMTISKTEYEEQSRLDSPPVLALHILHSLVTHSSLTHHLVRHMPVITIVCLQAFTSKSWSLRNAALQLYGAVVPRMVGQKKVQDDSSALNCLTVCEFVSRHPELAKHLLHVLRRANDHRESRINASDNFDKSDTYSIQASSRLVPVLSLLSRLSPGTGLQQGKELREKLQEYRSLTCSHLNSPIHTVRRLASLSVVALTPTEEALEIMGILVAALKTEVSANQINGSLLTLEQFLKIYPEFLTDVSLKKSLFTVLPLLQNSNSTCFVNATVALKILKLYHSSDATLNMLNIPSVDSSLPGASLYWQTGMMFKMKSFADKEIENYLVGVFSHRETELYFLNHIEDHLKQHVSSAWMTKIEVVIFLKLTNIEDIPAYPLMRILCMIVKKQGGIREVPTEMCMRNLLLLLQGYHGAKTASVTLVFIAYVIKVMHTEPWLGITNKTDILGAFSRVIGRYSDPKSTEDYRQSASKALEISLSSLFAFHIDAFEYIDALIRACMNLLQDEDSLIRESACHFVYELQMSLVSHPVLSIVEQSNIYVNTMQLVHPNLALRNFVDVIVMTSIFTKNMPVLRTIWSYCSFDHPISRSQSKTYLFESQAVNLYKEPYQLCLYVTSTIEREIKKHITNIKLDNTISIEHMKLWIKDECEVLSKQGEFLENQLKKQKEIHTDIKFITSSCMYIVTSQTLKSIAECLCISFQMSSSLSWNPNRFCDILYLTRN